jgi:hypothetical protein
MMWPKSKRFRFAFYAFHFYMITGILAAWQGWDLNALALFFTATSIPIVGYIVGDSLRQSDLTDLEK